MIDKGRGKIQNEVTLVLDLFKQYVNEVRTQELYFIVAQKLLDTIQKL